MSERVDAVRARMNELNHDVVAAKRKHLLEAVAGREAKVLHTKAIEAKEELESMLRERNDAAAARARAEFLHVERDSDPVKSFSDRSHLRHVPRESQMSAASYSIMRTQEETNQSILIGIQVYDGDLQAQKVAHLMEERVCSRWHRFCCMPQSDGRLVRDENFNVFRHVYRCTPPVSGDAGLHMVVEAINTTPMLPNQPPWEIFVVNDKDANETTLVWRLHHVITDGPTFGAVMATLSDQGYHPKVPTWSISRVLMFAYLYLWMFLMAPVVLFKWLWIATHKEAPSVFSAKPSKVKHMDWCTLPMAQVKDTAHALHVTINDLFLALVAGAMRSTMKDDAERKNSNSNSSSSSNGDGSAYHPPPVRISFPVNVRTSMPTKDLGNQFGFAVVSLPTDVKGSLKRVKLLHSRLAWIKKSPEAQLAYRVGRLSKPLPDFAAHKVFTTCTSKLTAVATNVAGLRNADRNVLAVDKKPIKRSWGLVPPPPPVAAGFMCYSHSEHFTMALTLDANVPVSPSEVLARAKAEFAHIQALIMKKDN